MTSRDTSISRRWCTNEYARIRAQRVGGTDAELDHDHPGGLVDLRAVPHCMVEPSTGPVGPRFTGGRSGARAAWTLLRGRGHRVVQLGGGQVTGAARYMSSTPRLTEPH